MISLSTYITWLIPNINTRDKIAQIIYNPIGFICKYLWWILFTLGHLFLIIIQPSDSNLKYPKFFNFCFKIHLYFFSGYRRRRIRIFHLILAKKLSRLFNVPFHLPKYY